MGSVRQVLPYPNPDPEGESDDNGSMGTFFLSVNARAVTGL